MLSSVVSFDQVPARVVLGSKRIYDFLKPNWSLSLCIAEIEEWLGRTGSASNVDDS